MISSSAWAIYYTLNAFVCEHKNGCMPYWNPYKLDKLLVLCGSPLDGWQPIKNPLRSVAISIVIHVFLDYNHMNKELDCNFFGADDSPVHH